MTMTRKTITTTMRMMTTIDDDDVDDDDDDDDVDDNGSLYSVSTEGLENFFLFIQRNGQYLVTSRENDSNTNEEDDDDVYSISSVGFE